LSSTCFLSRVNFITAILPATNLYYFDFVELVIPLSGTPRFFVLNLYLFIWLRRALRQAADRFFCLPRFICSFLLLAQKKRTKEKGSLKSFLGLTFYRLPTHYNSPSLHSGSNSNAYLSLPLRNLKNVNLFPKKIWWRCSPDVDLGEI